MRTAVLFLACAPCALMSLPASAQDAVASTAITSGSYERAETSLRKELRVHPGQPELLLNLAAVCLRTGRQVEARALYQRVLGEDDVLMDLTTDQTVGSHALARAALVRLDSVQVSAR